MSVLNQWPITYRTSFIKLLMQYIQSMEIQHLKLYIGVLGWINFSSASSVWMQIWDYCLKLSCLDWD